MSNRKTLLLNSSYEVLNLLPERRALKLLFKDDKVEVISSWDEEIVWGSGRTKHPAILRLKYSFKRNYFNSNFSRKSLIKRDNGTCQFCGKKLTPSQITVDHVIPRAQGGITSFTNCVVSCHDCNFKKANRTPEQAEMKLLKKPSHPSFTANYYMAEPLELWHSSWKDFLKY